MQNRDKSSYRRRCGDRNRSLSERRPEAGSDNLGRRRSLQRSVEGSKWQLRGSSIRPSTKPSMSSQAASTAAPMSATFSGVRSVLVSVACCDLHVPVEIDHQSGEVDIRCAGDDSVEIIWIALGLLQA